MFEVVWFPRYGSGQTDKQTNRQTDILITILRTLPADQVTKTTYINICSHHSVQKIE